jgi:hypothetical protein
MGFWNVRLAYVGQTSRIIASAALGDLHTFASTCCVAVTFCAPVVFWLAASVCMSFVELRVLQYGCLEVV